MVITAIGFDVPREGRGEGLTSRSNPIDDSALQAFSVISTGRIDTFLQHVAEVLDLFCRRFR